MTICQNVQFFIRSKTNISNVAIKRKKTEKPYTAMKTPINLSVTFNHCAQFPRNSQSTLTMNICNKIRSQRINCMALSPLSSVRTEFARRAFSLASCSNRLERSVACITLC